MDVIHSREQEASKPALSCAETQLQGKRGVARGTFPVTEAIVTAAIYERSQP
jgi:hypothetical protein